MRDCGAAPFRLWRRTRLAVVAIAVLTALALAGAAGHSEAAGQPSNTAATANSGPYPDPGNDLTDPGIPGNPPPPPGGIGAPGPGSPDSGVTLPPTRPAHFNCVLGPNEEERECFRPDGGARYTVCAQYPYAYAFKLVETLASDGTLFRTWRFGTHDCQKLSVLPNTIVRMISDSSYPRISNTNVRGTRNVTTDDFLCEVRIHDPYFPDDWRNHTKCTWTGGNSWLATFTNYGDRPVDVNEWYGASRHGRTQLLPGEAKIIPLHSQGEFFVGVGGPEGPPIKVTVSDYYMANDLREMWVRDTARTGFRDLADNTAVNLSPYTVRLSWCCERPGSVELPPYGRGKIGPQPGAAVNGEKAYGNGEVARVLFIEPGGGGADEYEIVTPPPGDPDHPHGFVTWLFNPYRSVKVENLGPWPVSLVAWFIPHLWEVGELNFLPVGQSAILPLFDWGKGIEATEITGIVYPPLTGRASRIRTTEWMPCCATRVAPTVNTLTGSATGLDAGQVQLRLQGRLTLAPSAGGLDIGRANVTLTSLLDEGRPAVQLPAGPDIGSQVGAAGELVEALGPYGTQLVPVGRSGAATVFLEKPPPGASPLFRMQITPRSSRVFDFTLNVANSALSGEPQLCSAGKPSLTDLATRLFIYDNRGRPIDVATTKPWECVGSEPQPPSALLLQ